MDASLERMLAQTAAELSGSMLIEPARRRSLKVGSKAFAYTEGPDVVLKLPVLRVEQLAGTADARVLVMGERAVRRWVVLSREDPRLFGDDLALCAGAMAFIGWRRGEENLFRLPGYRGGFAPPKVGAIEAA